MRGRTTEKTRLKIQAALDAAKTQLERNKLGQFATPTQLANDILTHALDLLPHGPVRFLDPAIGTGSFYSALEHIFPKQRITKATGYEVDEHYGKPSQELWEKHDLEVRLGDFTTATNHEDGYNLVICNPPYVRHHHLKQNEKLRLKSRTEKISGTSVSGLSGLYSYFLMLSHEWMSDDGIAGWLIPSEFMDVNYGSALKHYLLNEVTLLQIHRFNPLEVQFDDALVSSVVVWFKKTKPTSNHTVQFTYGGSLSQPEATQHVSLPTLKACKKWTQLNAEAQETSAPKLSELFTIKRGLATGDNKFFILSPEQIEAQQLPQQFLKPILPNPRYIPTNEVEEDANGDPLLDRKRYLLDCRLPEAEVKAKYPQLWAYLQTGLSSVASRYLCRSRVLWYQQEKREPALFVCTYMGRSSNPARKPFRFILNRSQAVAGNIYLMLYPKPQLASALAKHPDLASQLLEVLNAIPVEALLKEGRVYGGGLYKLEPKELANVRLHGIDDFQPVHSDDKTFTEQHLRLQPAMAS